jgi:hypothetical protein
MRDLIAPEEGLPIALFQGGEGTARPKRVTHIANGPFHPAFLVSGTYLAGTSCEVVVSAEFHQTRVKVDLIATPFQYGTAEIVIENDARLARPSLKGVDMAAQEVLHSLIEEKLQVQRTRVGQGDDKARQAPAGTSDCNFAEVRPIGLRLFGRKGMQAQEWFRSSRPQVGHDALQLADAALVAALADHLVDTCGPQSGMLVQSQPNEVQVGIG